MIWEEINQIQRKQMQWKGKKTCLPMIFSHEFLLRPLTEGGQCAFLLDFRSDFGLESKICDLHIEFP